MRYDIHSALELMVPTLGSNTCVYRQCHRSYISYHTGRRSSVFWANDGMTIPSIERPAPPKPHAEQKSDLIDLIKIKMLIPNAV